MSPDRRLAREAEDRAADRRSAEVMEQQRGGQNANAPPRSRPGVCQDQAEIGQSSNMPQKTLPT